MRSNTEDTGRIRISSSGSTTDSRSDQHTEIVDFAESHFVYEVTETGFQIFAPNQNSALILIEPVRNLKWKIGGGEELTASFTAGTAFIIPAHHTMEVLWPEPAVYLQLTLPAIDPSRDSMRNSESSSTGPVGNIINFSSKQCLQVSQLVIEQLREPQEIDQSYMASLYSVLVHLLQRNAQMVEASMVMPNGLSSYAARQIEAYLKEKFREPVSVPDMALALGISAGHFATRFRESFGQTPHQYLMSLRLDEAERWLRETDIPISTVAARLSFSSQSHLTTALRKYRRLTPGELRRRSSHLRYQKPKTTP